MSVCCCVHLCEVGKVKHETLVNFKALFVDVVCGEVTLKG